MASVPQSEQLARTPELPLPKGAESFVQIVGWQRVKVSESRTLAREREIIAGARRGKGELHREGRFQGGKGGQAKRASLEK